MQLQGLQLGISDPAPVPGSLDQRSTDWATEAIAVSLGASSVYIQYSPFRFTHMHTLAHRHAQTQLRMLFVTHIKSHIQQNAHADFRRMENVEELRQGLVQELGSGRSLVEDH